MGRTQRVRVHPVPQPLYAILLDGGFLTKKLYATLGHHATADDVVAECERLKAIPQVAGYELLRIYYYDARGLLRCPRFA